MDMDANQKGRTDFLTILCVLSLIGSTLLVVTGINQYREADLTSALIRQQMEKGKVRVNVEGENGENDTKRAKEIMDTAAAMVSPDLIKKYQIGSIITNLLTLFGAFMMFRHRKIGFWIYLIGTAAFVALPFWVYGLDNKLAYGIGMLAGFIGVIFVLLYARNLRYMN